jgi:hypothetical protein
MMKISGKIGKPNNLKTFGSYVRGMRICDQCEERGSYPPY